MKVFKIGEINVTELICLDPIDYRGISRQCLWFYNAHQLSFFI